MGAPAVLGEAARGPSPGAGRRDAEDRRGASLRLAGEGQVVPGHADPCKALGFYAKLPREPLDD